MTEPTTAAGRALIDMPYSVAGITSFHDEKLLAAILDIEAEDVERLYALVMDAIDVVDSERVDEAFAQYENRAALSFEEIAARLQEQER